MIDRVVANRLSIYLINESLKDIDQSAYKRYHSAETALLCVDNNIRKALGGWQGIIVLLIDLSAAFDTIDHIILLNRMKRRHGLAGLYCVGLSRTFAGRMLSLVVQLQTKRQRTQVYRKDQC